MEYPRIGSIFRVVVAAMLVAIPTFAQVETLLCGFEPGAEEPYAVVGAAKFETAADRVRSGAASLRILCGPPEAAPGLRLPGASLKGRGFRKVTVDVLNPQAEPVPLVVRADGEGAAFHRRIVPLANGWNVIEIDLDRLETGRGGKVDPERIVLLSLTIDRPPLPVELIFDGVRGTAPSAKAESPAAAGIRALTRFEAQYPAESDPEAKAGLLLGLAPFDVPGRATLLDRMILGVEDDARFVAEAIRVLITTVDPAAAAEAVLLAERSVGRRRLRWCEVIAGMKTPESDAFVRSILAKKATHEAVVVLAARARRPTPDLLPVLGSDLGGGWQIDCARVRTLAGLGTELAFDPLADHLKSEYARVRADAREALTALSGRDLGEDAAAWRSWRSATSTRPALADERGRYGRATYYGIPLSPGRVCFVLDVSGSMHAALQGASADYASKNGRTKDKKIPTRLDLAREELSLAIGELHPRAVFHMVFFSGSVFQWEDGPLEASKENKERAKRYLKRLGANGSTNLHGGLLAALEPNGDAATDFRKSFDAVYLLTDGEPTAGRLQETGSILADLADRNRGRLVKMHTVGLGEADCTLLRELARDSQGVFVDLAK